MFHKDWDMRLSKKGEYALKALMELAYHHGDGLLSSEQIARQGEIPRSFLEQILLSLKRGGFVESQRGAEGGYRLRRAPEAIRIGAVIRLIDGPLAPLNDGQTLEALVRSQTRHRGLYSALLDVRQAIVDVLDHTTLADLCDRVGGGDGAARLAEAAA